MLKTFIILLTTFSLTKQFDLAQEFELIISEQKYFLELSMISIIIILIYNYIIGCQKNRKILHNFYKKNLTVLKKNFYHCGLKLAPIDELDPDLNLEKFLQDENLVEEDTPYFFRSFFAGRENTKFCILTLSLKRRQDLLVSFFYSLFYPEKDRVSIEVALPSNWDIKGLLYIIRNKKIKEKVNEYEDLKFLCKKYNIKGLEKNRQFSIFAENSELVEFLFNKIIKEKLGKLGNMIESLELSDCYKNELHKGNNIKMNINLGKCKISDFENCEELFELFFEIIDRLEKYKPSDRVYEKYVKNRNDLFKKKKKEENLENEVNLREERIKKMSPYEKKKYLEKMKKRQKNKMSKRMAVVKKA